MASGRGNEDRPLYWFYSPDTTCHLCMCRIYPRSLVRAVVQDTDKVSPVFDLQFGPHESLVLGGRVLTRWRKSFAAPASELAYLVHDFCYSIICAVAKSPGGEVLWRFCFSLESSGTTSYYCTNRVAIKSLQDSLVRYCNHLSSSAECDETSVNAYLRRLPMDIVFHIAEYIPQRSYYWQCLVSMMQAARLVENIRSLDKHKRIIRLDLTKELHITCVDIGGSSYISGFHDSKVPHSRVLRLPGDQEIVFVWDDFGLHDIQTSADVASNSTKGRFPRWYQLMENVAMTTFSVDYKGFMVRSITDKKWSGTRSSRWDTPCPPKPEDLVMFATHDIVSNNTPEISLKISERQHRLFDNLENFLARSLVYPLRTADLRRQRDAIIGLVMPVEENGYPIGISAVYSMDKTPQILVDAPWRRCKFFPLRQYETITHLWIQEQENMAGRHRLAPIHSLVMRTSHGRHFFSGRYVPRKYRHTCRYFPLASNDSDSMVTAIYYHCGKRPGLAATCSKRRSCPRLKDCSHDDGDSFRHEEDSANDAYVPLSQQSIPIHPNWPIAIDTEQANRPWSIWDEDDMSSIVSLEDVTAVETFGSDSSGNELVDLFDNWDRHVGAVFHYANGDSESIGSIRIGEAPRTVVHSPTSVWWWERVCVDKVDACDRLHLRGGLHFTSEDVPPASGAGWVGRPMVGSLYWSFDHCGSCVRVVQP